MKNSLLKVFLMTLVVALSCACLVACADETGETADTSASEVTSASAAAVTLTTPTNLRVERNYIPNTKKSQCVVTFDRNKDAYEFVVTMGDEQYKTGANRYILKNVEENKEYTVTVHAKDKTGANVSEKVSATFTYHAVTAGVAVMALKDGTYEVTYQRADDEQITGTVYFPDTVDGKNVSRLSQYCLGRYKETHGFHQDDPSTLDLAEYHGDNNVTTGVVLPNTLANVCEHAFDGCKALTSLTLPDNVKTISGQAFYQSGLVSVTLPAGVTLEDRAFYNCSALESVNIDAASYVGADVFGGNCKWMADKTEDFVVANGYLLRYQGNATRLEAKDFPATVKEICGYAFAYVETVAYLQIPANVVMRQSNCLSGVGPQFTLDLSLYESLPTQALQSRNLGEVVLPAGLTEIPDNCFKNAGISSIDLPSGVAKIGASAFENCFNLQSVDLSHVTELGSGAFMDCAFMTSVTLSSAITKIPDNCFSGCSSLSEIDLSAVTSIGANAFSSCRALETVNLSEALESVGAAAFSGCGLKSITIPASVTSLGVGQFGRCTSLESVTINMTSGTIGERLFDWCFSLTDVYLNVTESEFDSMAPNGIGVHEGVTVHFKSAA